MTTPNENLSESQRNVLAFVAIVEGFFPRPKFAEEKGRQSVWMRTLGDMLGHYKLDVLQEAARLILQTRNPEKSGTMFPKPSECIAACEDVIKLRRGATLRLEAPKGDEWSDERITLAFDLANGPLGRRAAREGWISPLMRFCRQNMRLPKDGEIADCIALARGFDEDRQKLRDGTIGGELARPLAQWAESIAARSEEYAKRILGDAA